MHTQHNVEQPEPGTINRRRFLQSVGAGAVLLAAGAGVRSYDAGAIAAASDRQPLTAPVNGVFVVPPLPYNFAALEPHIDALTMQIHHDRHHAAYVNNLNTAVKDNADLRKRDATDLIANLDDLPEALRPAIRNNAGGHVNHAIFWATMAPRAGGEPNGQLRKAIDATFGSFAAFKAQLTDAAMKRFGSGWAWLVRDRAGKLAIMSTANQDSPYMFGMTALVGVDVWEHAYYLKYQNKRADYVAAWWNVVNWHAVAQRYEKA
jgi:Fe-Mn family superoxide dismutase